MILHIYRAETEYRYYYDSDDIDISKYRFCETIITNYINIDDLIYAIESKEIEFDFEETDLIELALGLEELNDNHGIDNIGYEKEQNFLLIYGLGVKRIALDHEIFYSDLVFNRLKHIF